ncbi:helix-turn-helix domain-containing protein [Alkaliphilus sp. B6464]|uniref:helix-turn-helix domain-containing protein n=1 Tax=Alkaliphilus sp. B6464 TaxID=2731219 RepID=UPI001BAA3BF7|nr:helix-turn-helix domain-containing protein [Alkaliphilus sp. B6464]QUH20211.1 helix-turn-helix domain-containing protein [Alkaliphilus sp. B6464]
MKLTKYNYHQFVKLNPTQKVILDCVLSYAYGNKNYAFPSQETIAEEINVCRHTVMRNLRKIEQIRIR